MDRATALIIFFLALLLPACVVHPAMAADIAGTITATKGTTIFIEVQSDLIPRIGDMVDVQYRVGEDIIPVGKWRVSGISGGKVTADPVEMAGEPAVGMSAVIVSPNPGNVNSPANPGNTTTNGSGASLGAAISELDSNLRQQHDIPAMWSGVFVVDVKTASAAEKAGLRKEDIIVSFDNEPVQDQPGIVNAIRAKNPGDQAHLVVLRNGRPLAMTATLDRADSVAEGESAMNPPDQGSGGENTRLEGDCGSGDAKACASLADRHAAGSGVVQDYGRAAELYQKSCDGGYAEACNKLGDYYKDGRGVAPDLRQAARLHEIGCNGGSARSCNSLGLQYANGGGVPQDNFRAFQLFGKSCTGGEQSACSNLGVMYKDGRGVSANEAKAAELFEQSCNAGEKLGCGNLGNMYLHGTGVRKDVKRAEALLQRSCNAGLDWSCGKLQEIASAGAQPAPQTPPAPQTTSPARQQQQNIDRDRESRKAARELLPALLDLQRQLTGQHNRP